MEENIINRIESEKPQLSSSERSLLWQRIETSLPARVQPIVSPYNFFITLNYKTMTAFALMLLLIITSGGTAYASNAARPGDTLFPIDRALEDIQLRLALTDDSRNKLAESLTQERLQELRDIIDEETIVSQTNIADDSFASSTLTTTQGLMIEADAFIDTTVVKIELNDKKFYFEIQAKTREEAIAAILIKFPMLTVEQIGAVLDFEIEDRVSVPKDRGIATFKDGGQVRVTTAVDAILRFLNDTSSDEVSRHTVQALIQKELVGSMDVRKDADSIRIDNDDNRIKIRMDDDGDSRFEIREGASRVRIEQKDGEVRVKTEDKKENDDSFDDSALKNAVKLDAVNQIRSITDDLNDDSSLFDDEDKREDRDDVRGRGSDDDNDEDEDRDDDDDDEDRDHDEDRGDDN